jgi:hypothetical protein
MSLNFKLVTPFIDLGVRAFPFADTGILLPSNANPLVDGEFLELNSSYKLVRGSGDPAAVLSFAYFLEQGAYTAQGLGKGPVLMLHGYEADTKIFNSGGSFAYGTPVCVGDVTIGSLVKRGLRNVATPGTDHVIGFCTRAPADNNGWLRFLRVA